MTDSRAPDEPYTTTFEATVEAADGRDVVLDATYFYPEGGGQPADRGTLAGVEVVDVQERDGGVVHSLDGAPSIDPGDAVIGRVDRAFRTYCMRAHTASHALYGAGRRLLDDLGYGGFAITEEKVRVDFSTPTDVDDGTLAELERLVNRTVWESREVSWETRPKEEALAMDDIAFNTKTEEGIEAEAVRVVTIGGPEGVGGASDDAGAWDVAACGGTHVRNTREIGPVTVLGRSNPGEGLTRVEMAVGPPGIERRIAEKRALLEAAGTLGTAPTDVPGEAERLRGENADLEERVAELEDRAIGARIDDLRDEVVEKDGVRWLVGEVDGADANALGERAKALAGDDAAVVALVGRDGRTFLAVAADGGDANDVVEAVTDEFGGGGGGSPAFAQAGGIDAPPEEIVSFLRG